MKDSCVGVENLFYATKGETVMRKICIFSFVILCLTSCTTMKIKEGNNLVIPFTLENKAYPNCPVVTVKSFSNSYFITYYTFIVDTGWGESQFFNKEISNSYIMLNLLNDAIVGNSFVKPKTDKIDGIVGEDFLSQFCRVDFDYSKRVIEFDCPSFVTESESSIEFFPLEEVGKVPIMNIVFKENIDKAIIDTGCSAPFILRNIEINRDYITDYKRTIISQSILMTIKNETLVEDVNFSFGNICVYKAQGVYYDDPCLVALSSTARGGAAIYNIIGSPLLGFFNRFQIDYENMKFRVY